MIDSFSTYKKHHSIDTFHTHALAFPQWMQRVGYLDTTCAVVAAAWSQGEVYLTGQPGDNPFRDSRQQMELAQNRQRFNGLFSSELIRAGFDENLREKLTEQHFHPLEFSEMAKRVSGIFLSNLDRCGLFQLRNNLSFNFHAMDADQVSHDLLFHLRQRQNLCSDPALRSAFKSDLWDYLQSGSAYLDNQKLCYLFATHISPAFFDATVFVFPQNNLDLFFMFSFLDDN